MEQNSETKALQGAQAQPLVSRPAPLSQDDFKALEDVIAKTIKIKPITQLKTVPKVDAEGNIYGWESDMVVTGHEVFAVGTILPKLVDAVRRPATAGHIQAHLTRLAAHLRFTKGDKAWKLVTDDLCSDLDGVSEWAVVKACAEFRSAGKPFFPDTPDMIAGVRKWDALGRSIELAGSPKPAKQQKPKAASAPRGKPNDEQKARVAKILHDAHIAHDKEFCAACQAEAE